LRHPASQVSFEAVHVGCTSEFRLTGDFIGDVLGEENVEGCVEETVYSLFPKSTAIRLGNVSSGTLTGRATLT
jgi:hypothetical protein